MNRRQIHDAGSFGWLTQIWPVYKSIPAAHSLNPIDHYFRLLCNSYIFGAVSADAGFLEDVVHIILSTSAPTTPLCRFLFNQDTTPPPPPKHRTQHRRHKLSLVKIKTAKLRSAPVVPLVRLHIDLTLREKWRHFTQKHTHTQLC